uniref:Uncharacterized protein n=1 Tax=Oryza barthii TaxID=65489 RepID=A0A0D3HTS0_9ORYZ
MEEVDLVAVWGVVGESMAGKDVGVGSTAWRGAGSRQRRRRAVAVEEAYLVCGAEVQCLGTNDTDSNTSTTLEAEM